MLKRRAVKRDLVTLVLGTRPEIIKLSPVIRLLKERGKAFRLVHTGQHYSYSMDRLFFKELRLPEPHTRLDIVSLAVAGEGHAAQVGRMMVALDKLFAASHPGTVLVQGDTNSVLAGALAAAKTAGARLGHVEAGLRSYDRGMPEENNRIVADHLSDHLFAPTAVSARILQREAVPASKIYVTGNTIVDAVFANLKLARAGRPSAKYAEFLDAPFMLTTLHRQENVDEAERLSMILRAYGLVHAHFGLPIVFPAHPRTTRRMREFGLRAPKGLHIVEPAGFMDFLRLESAARLILTDSGGVQEEACILRVPCVTLRTTTERPETVSVGANRVAGFNEQRILTAAKRAAAGPRRWANPYGDGRAAERILKVVSRHASSGS